MAKQKGRGGMRPGAGRKAKPLGEKQRNRVVLLLTDDELRQFGRAADAESLGTYARRIVLRHLARRRK